MTTAQVFSNGVQLGSPAPPDKYPLYGTGTGDVSGPAVSTDNALVRFDGTTGKLVKDSVVTVSDLGAVVGIITINGQPVGNCSGPASAVDTGIARFNGSSGKLITDNPSTIDMFGGITLAAGAQCVPIPVPVPSPTPFNYYEARDPVMTFTGPFAGSVVSNTNVQRIGDRLIMVGIGEILQTGDGSIKPIEAVAGSIPANFTPSLTRILPIPVTISSGVFAMGLVYVYPSGRILIGPDLNTSNVLNPNSFNSVAGQPVGFRAYSFVYSI